MLVLLETIDPFSLVLALVPLIGYLLVLAAIRLSGRSLVTTGGRDIAALGMAISGFVAVGPAELFFPTTAATLFGPVVWFALFAFYGLSLSLIALTVTPRLVVYGRLPADVYEAMLRSAKRMDDSASGDPRNLQIQMPTLDVQLRVDAIGNLDHCRIDSFEPVTSIKFWNTLLGYIRADLDRTVPPKPRRGFGMLMIASVLLVVLAWHCLNNQATLLDGFRNWLWR